MSFMHLLVLQIPQVCTKTVAAIKVNLQEANEIMSKATKTLISPPAFFHLVKTDKPIDKIYQRRQVGRGTQDFAIVWRRCLCRGYFKCDWVSSCCTLDIVFLLIQPTLSILCCLLIQLHLHKFRLHQSVCIMISHGLKTFIKQQRDLRFLKNSW